MASNNVQAALAVLFELLPKAAAFEAGQPIEVPIPAESYTVPIGGQNIEVSEPGLTVTIKKVG